ncbi:MAG: asparagine synthase (glutamine-hydrolyzing) [Candidatus Kapaibacterium sp.]
MCGIAGIFDHSGAEPSIDDALLEAMGGVIHHRGPDSGDTWISPDRRCGLAFRRLAIIDLSPAGNQPMTTPDGRYSIVFNGEIYNHAEIREKLAARGWKYRSGTDTETILYGFAEFGEKILDMMLGMWAIAIWDDSEKRLFCARDRIGIKPFYYYNSGGKFIFGSEIKSILRHPDVKRSVNFEELPNYLNFGMSGKNGTLFENITKIPAGHYLFVNSDGQIHKQRYWSPIRRDTDYLPEDESAIKSEIIRGLRQSIKDRMMSDVPFGVFLSGGVDSSLNVALMDELMDRPVDTFTVGFRELEQYNELKYARQIADLFKTNHHEILIDDTDALPVLEDLVWHEDEPNADPVCIPLYFLSKLTRDSGTTVIQVGEGSDEQYMGYPWMLREYRFHESLWQFYRSMPAFLRKGAYALGKAALVAAGQPLALDYLRRGTFGDELYWSGISIFSPTHLNNLFTSNYQNYSMNPAVYARQLHLEIQTEKPDADYLQRILYVELQQRLAEILLMRVDKIGMAHSIEARVPFLDHRLVEMSMRLPPKIKVPDSKTTKYILKKAVEGILPDNIIYRKKQGFAAPVVEWLRGKWFDYASNTILNSFFVKDGIFDREYVLSLMNTHKSAKKDLSREFFSLLTLSLWHKRMIG